MHDALDLINLCVVFMMAPSCDSWAIVTRHTTYPPTIPYRFPVDTPRCLITLAQVLLDFKKVTQWARKIHYRERGGQSGQRGPRGHDGQ